MIMSPPSRLCIAQRKRTQENWLKLYHNLLTFQTWFHETKTDSLWSTVQNFTNNNSSKKLSIVTNKVTQQVTGFSIYSFSCLLSSSDHPSRQMQLTNAKKSPSKQLSKETHTCKRKTLSCLSLSVQVVSSPPPSLSLSAAIKMSPSVYLSIPTFACTTFLSFHAVV